MSTSDASTPDPRASQAGMALAWVAGASVLHLASWLVLLAYSYFWIPRQRKVYADLGVELSDAANLLIQWANLTLTYWHFSLPMLLISVITGNAAIVILVRSRHWRLVLIVLMAMAPVGWLLQFHLTLQVPLDRLLQQVQ